jgi:DNA-binding MarR family transcriptional regulator
MPDTGPDETFSAFFLEVGILAQLSRAMFEARLPPGFSLPQFTVLNHLVRVKDGRTPLELARAFQVPKTSMTHSVAVLERHGLIEIRPNARDGRSKQIFITEAGRSFRQTALAGLQPDLAALADRFSAARLASVLPTLTDLRQLMDQMRDPDPQ